MIKYKVDVKLYRQLKVGKHYVDFIFFIWSFDIGMLVVKFFFKLLDILLVKQQS